MNTFFHLVWLSTETHVYFCVSDTTLFTELLLVKTPFFTGFAHNNIHNGTLFYSYVHLQV